ncbi:MAG: hypothetical protein RLY20_3360 [Verrucomicrobiota bacterium]|jgi:hypothetical protein
MLRFPRQENGRINPLKPILQFGLLLLAATVACGQNLAPNPSFESGLTAPDVWSSSYPDAEYANSGHSGIRSVAIAGNGSTMTRWLNTTAGITNGQAYALRFWTRTTNAAGGGCFAGFNTVYSDFALPGLAWTNYSMVAWLPAGTPPELDLGQVVVNGKIYFDDVELYSVLPIHKLAIGKTLGAGERLEPGRYRYQSTYANYGGSYSRCLVDSGTSFASFRWYMNPGSSLIYRHDLAGWTMKNATATAQIWNYNGISGGTLQFDASTNGVDWIPFSVMSDGATNAVVTLPPSLFPATQVFIRLRSVANNQFSLLQYSLAADLATNVLTLDGSTYFLEQRQHNPAFVPLSVADSGAGQILNLAVSNAVPELIVMRVESVTDGVTNVSLLATNLPAGQSNLVWLPVPSPGLADSTVTITATNSTGQSVYKTLFVVPVQTSAEVFGNLDWPPTVIPL